MITVTTEQAVKTLASLMRVPETRFTEIAPHLTVSHDYHIVTVVFSKEFYLANQERCWGFHKALRKAILSRGRKLTGNLTKGTSFIPGSFPIAWGPVVETKTKTAPKR